MLIYDKWQISICRAVVSIAVSCHLNYIAHRSRNKFYCILLVKVAKTKQQKPSLTVIEGLQYVHEGPNSVTLTE